MIISIFSEKQGAWTLFERLEEWKRWWPEKEKGCWAALMVFLMPEN